MILLRIALPFAFTSLLCSCGASAGSGASATTARISFAALYSSVNQETAQARAAAIDRLGSESFASLYRALLNKSSDQSLVIGDSLYTLNRERTIQLASNYEKLHALYPTLNDFWLDFGRPKASINEAELINGVRRIAPPTKAQPAALGLVEPWLIATFTMPCWFTAAGLAGSQVAKGVKKYGPGVASACAAGATSCASACAAGATSCASSCAAGATSCASSCAAGATSCATGVKNAGLNCVGGAGDCLSSTGAAMSNFARGDADQASATNAPGAQTMSRTDAATAEQCNAAAQSTLVAASAPALPEDQAAAMQAAALNYYASRAGQSNYYSYPSVVVGYPPNYVNGAPQ